jgi:transposase
MNKPDYYVGIDLAADSFTSAIGQMAERWQIVARPASFVNSLDGFPQYLSWLQAHGLTPANSVICMEATGVYGEVLAHYLAAHGYRLAVEPPLKVKRAFKPEGHKSDPVDGEQIAEYAYRFWDELSVWSPRSAVLEQIQTLLTLREQFVGEKTGHANALHALRRKAVRMPLADHLHEQALRELKDHIHTLEVEIRRLIDQDPDFRNLVALLLSIPGVELLLAAHLLVVLQGAPVSCSPKSLAAFIGICPYEHASGSSVRHTPTSRHYGPPALRKLLFLAAMSIATHNPQFRLYYLRKLQEGKAKPLVLNNIANKLLKVILAVVRSQTRFIPNYHSVNPPCLR